MAEVVKSHIENKPTRCRDATQFNVGYGEVQRGREREKKHYKTAKIDIV